jgi:hypothetical protein
VTLEGIIPGGQSFQITVPPRATSVNWAPQVEPGTQFFILAGDSRGRGTGGSSAIQNVANGSRSCLTGGAYSSTQSPFAGQVSATSSPTKGSSGGGGGGNNSTLIVGVIVGFLALCALAGALLYLRYRRKRHSARKVDLFRNNDDSHDDPAGSLEPTPFLPPPPVRTLEQGSERGSIDGSGYRFSSSTFHSGLPPAPVGYASSFGYVGRGPPSAPLTDSSNTWDDSRTDSNTHITSLLDGTRSPTPTSAGFSVMNPDGGHAVRNGGGSGSRKEAPPRIRPVNFVQHRDAGTVEPTVHEEAELIELPPSYADVGRNATAADIAPPPQPPPAPAAPAQ